MREDVAQRLAMPEEMIEKLQQLLHACRSKEADEQQIVERFAIELAQVPRVDTLTAQQQAANGSRALSGNGDYYKQNIDKLSRLVQEKERRIAELLQFEYSSKKLKEQKFELERLAASHEAQNRTLRQENCSLQATLTASQSEYVAMQVQCQQLTDQQNHSICENRQLQEALAAAHSQIEQLKNGATEQLTEQMALTEKLAAANSRNEELSEELDCLYEQLAALKERYKLQQDALMQLQVELAQQREFANAKERSVQESVQRLADKDKSLRAVEQEVIAIKQNLIRGLRQSKELEGRYFEAMNEKVAVLTKYQQLKAEAEKCSQERDRFREALKEALQREMSIKKQSDEEQQRWQRQWHQQQEMTTQADKDKQQAVQRLDSLQQQLTMVLEQLGDSQQARQQFEEQYRQAASLLAEREASLHSCGAQIASLQEEIARLQVEGQRLISLQCDNEQQLAEALQHLGKKVRAATELQEVIDAQQCRMEEMSIDRQQAYAELQALQEQFEQRQQDEESWQLKVQNLESDIEQLQAQCRDLEEKCTAAERKVSELDALESRHLQMKGLLANLESVLGISGLSAVSHVAPPLETFGETPHYFKGDENAHSCDEETPSLSHSPYQNLFELPKSKEQLKGDLFE